MATTPKILGELKPAAATPTVLYTVPALCQAKFTIVVANQGAGQTKIKIALVPQGGTVTVSKYIAFNLPLMSGESVEFLGLYLGYSEFISVESDTGDASFVACGEELT